MTREREIAYIALMAAFIVVLRFIPAINLGIGVPITAQSLGIMLAGTLLGARRGFLAVLLFVVLALIGLPVLASGVVGIGIFYAPSVGFVLGFPIAAFVTGWICERMKEQNAFVAAFVSSVLGAIVLLYFLGVLGLMARTDLDFVGAWVAMAPFIPGDLIKAVIAGLITSSLVKLRPEWVLTR